MHSREIVPERRIRYYYKNVSKLVIYIEPMSNKNEGRVGDVNR